MIGLECLVAVIFFEARDQDIAGKEAVAEVVMNRVAHDDFPNSICEVVFEDRQFSFTHDGLSDDPLDYDTHFDEKSMLEIKNLAVEYISGRKAEIVSTHYHTTEISVYWNDIYEFDGIVGRHAFYTCSSKNRNC